MKSCFLRYSLLQTCALRLSPWLLLCTLVIGSSAGQVEAEPTFDIENYENSLEAIRKSHKLPGMGVAIVTDEDLEGLATTGVRKQGDRTSVTDKDLWHLGSCGKAMTATMIARLVEAGKMKFEQTLGETFPELDSKMSEQLKSITLIDLLSHTSGLPANYNLMNYVQEKNVARARRKVLRETLDARLLSKPGKKYLYSNWGYTLAGHMAEKTTGKSWEALMRIEVFKPLKMKTAGFGGTGRKGKINQPWPHAASGEPMPSNGKEMDNLPVMGPAGTIHMSLEDWGKFISEHLKGHRGKSDYLSQASFRKLHTAVTGDYALGWVPQSRSWAGGTALFHNGDNTMNHAVVWAAPEKGFAVLTVTNQSSAGKACDEVAWGFIEAWSKGSMTSKSSQEDSEKIAIDAKHRKRLEGRYQLAPNFIFDVKDREGHLMVSITNQPTQEVFPDSATHWSYRGVKATLEFKLPKSGPALSLVLHQNGMKQTARRVK